MEVEAVYVDRERWEVPGIAELVRRADEQGIVVYGLDATAVRSVSEATSPQPILATARFAPRGLDELAVDGLVLVLHDVQDPGNAGTVIRSAEAAGARAVILTGQSVDPYNPKTLRATTGAIFRVPVVVADLTPTLDGLARQHVRTLATVVREGDDVLATDLRAPTAILIGNEAAGLDDAVVARCDGRISIAMAGGESLNAGVAASLIAFVARWQVEGRGGFGAPRSLGRS